MDVDKAMLFSMDEAMGTDKATVALTLIMDEAIMSKFLTLSMVGPDSSVPWTV